VTDLSARLLSFVRDDVCAGSVELALDTDLLLTGAVDSLGVIRITQWLEDETGIEVDPGDVTLENFQTVDRMITYVEKRLANR
jgi:acyl carrier protein